LVRGVALFSQVNQIYSPGMAGVVHDEEFGKNLSWTGLLITSASLAFAAVEGVRGFPNALTLLIGLLGPIVGLTLWAVSRYSGIRVTEDALHIGGETLRRSDLDSTFGVRDSRSLTDEERALVEPPLPIPKSATVRIPGGAFGRIAGTDILVLRTADGAKSLAFFSRRREDLNAVLQRWLARTA
jgi:hypothetical protein